MNASLRWRTNSRLTRPSSFPAAVASSNLRGAKRTCTLALDLLTEILDRFANLARRFANSLLHSATGSLLGALRFEVRVPRHCAQGFLDAAFDILCLAFQLISVHGSPPSWSNYPVSTPGQWLRQARLPRYHNPPPP